MKLTSKGRTTLRVDIERWPRATPVRITGYTFDLINAVLVTLEQDGCVGRGEANVIYYRNEDAAEIARQIEQLRPSIEAGMTREELQRRLSPSPARNALDCAMWDLESKLTGRPVWQIAGLERPKPLVTTFTCHADQPAVMATRARGFPNPRAIKLKLTGEPLDTARICAVREAMPHVWLGIDANQGFTRIFLEELMPLLLEQRVALIEQPFRVGEEALLDGFSSPIPIAADESVQDRAGVDSLVGRFQVVNIKLDKCGGLTEGLAMARAAHGRGLEAMVGNMCGTSLAMAPAFLVGQLCNVVDLDGPILLKADRAITVEYSDGLIVCPEGLWG